MQTTASSPGYEGRPAHSNGRPRDWRADADRYLAINAWLKDRYRQPDGTLVTYERGMKQSIYTRLDIGFFLRYVAERTYSFGPFDGGYRVYRNGEMLPWHHETKAAAKLDADARNTMALEEAQGQEPEDREEHRVRQWQFL